MVSNVRYVTSCGSSCWRAKCDRVISKLWVAIMWNATLLLKSRLMRKLCFVVKKTRDSVDVKSSENNRLSPIWTQWRSCLASYVRIRLVGKLNCALQPVISKSHTDQLWVEGVLGCWAARPSMVELSHLVSPERAAGALLIHAVEGRSCLSAPLCV